MNNPRPFRLGSVEKLFDDSLKERQALNPNLNASTLIRWCVQQALSESEVNITPEVATELLNEIRSLRKEISRIGGNFNQIAHYFNIHSYLIETDLSRQHSEIQRQLKQTTRVLREVENGLVRRSY